MHAKVLCWAAGLGVISFVFQSLLLPHRSRPRRSACSTLAIPRPLRCRDTLATRQGWMKSRKTAQLIDLAAIRSCPTTASRWSFAEVAPAPSCIPAGLKGRHCGPCWRRRRARGAAAGISRHRGKHGQRTGGGRHVHDAFRKEATLRFGLQIGQVFVKTDLATAWNDYESRRRAVSRSSPISSPTTSRWTQTSCRRIEPSCRAKTSCSTWSAGMMHRAGGLGTAGGRDPSHAGRKRPARVIRASEIPYGKKGASTWLYWRAERLVLAPGEQGGCESSDTPD